MDEDVRQIRDLPFRIARSARALACSALSGVAGVEAGLRDPRRIAKRHAATSGVRKHYHAQSKLQHRKAAEQVFRSKSSTSASCAISQEFRDFQDGFPALDTNILDAVEPAAPGFSPWMQHGDLGHASAPDQVAEDEAVTGTELQCENVSTEHFIAALRLEQLNAHVAAKRARQEQAQLSLLKDHQHQYMSSRHKGSGQQNFHYASSRQDVHSATQGRTRKDADFHCPYIDCHRKLIQHNASVVPRASQTPCVHINCDHTSTGYKEWLDHVTTPHHDIQALAAFADNGDVAVMDS